jgi:hypothetical protein
VNFDWIDWALFWLVRTDKLYELRIFNAGITLSFRKENKSRIKQQKCNNTLYRTQKLRKINLAWSHLIIQNIYVFGRKTSHWKYFFKSRRTRQTESVGKMNWSLHSEQSYRRIEGFATVQSVSRTVRRKICTSCSLFILMNNINSDL